MFFRSLASIFFDDVILICSLTFSSLKKKWSLPGIGAAPKEAHGAQAEVLDLPCGVSAFCVHQHTVMYTKDFRLLKAKNVNFDFRLLQKRIISHFWQE